LKGGIDMKYLIKTAVCVLFISALAVGCSSKKEETKPTDTSPGVTDVIDYAIGKTPIEQGNKMKKEIKDIQKEHDEQLKEVMGDDK